MYCFVKFIFGDKKVSFRNELDKKIKESVKFMNRLIVHGLLEINGEYLLIKRTEIKRSKPNSLPNYWDIPGGMVELGELPRDALVRETKEEVNLDIEVKNIIHEDSNYDKEKDIVFTRLVYECELLDNQNVSNIILQEDEHSEYRLVNSLEEMGNEKVVDYLIDIIK